MDGNENDRLKQLYPFVDDVNTLPSCWSTKDKFQYLGLSLNNLRVHYKGQGKTHKDAAAVRADHPIPASCGLYYFEVRIVSKGRDGYMGIGLSQQGVSLNRLPGWDRFSYGYHGDDGNSFCSSGSGLPYGPTFTTDDVIGCGVNFVDNTCFYTKNGHNIGTAFTDLPPGLYPTVGLQTPGEVIDANFGKAPFVYDITEEMKEVQRRARASIEKYVLPFEKAVWFNKLVSGYLVHHGYCGTAEAFNKASGQTTPEDVISMKHRQNICKSVNLGHIGEAIRRVQQLYPKLFEQKRELFFMLKCRQFVEMLIGNDCETRRVSPRSSHSVSPSYSPQQYKLSHHSMRNRHSPLHSPKNSPRSSPRRIKSPRPRNSATPAHDSDTMHERNSSRNGCETGYAENCEPCVSFENGNSKTDTSNGVHAAVSTQETLSESTVQNASQSYARNGDFPDDVDGDIDGDCSMADNTSPSTKLGIDTTMAPTQLERLIQFGRELQQLSTQLKQQNCLSKKSSQMLNDAFSLLAYSDPWNCPVSYQLHPDQREPVAAALNSAILEMQGYQPKPALDVVNAHARRLRNEMASHGMGVAAFIDPDSFLATSLSNK